LPPQPKATDTKSGLKPIPKLGLHRPADFLQHLPLRYEDETRITLIDAVRSGEVEQVEGTVIRNEVSYRGRRMLLVELEDASGRIVLRFFNFYGSQQKQLAIGQRVRAMGEVRGGMLGREMMHPRYRLVREDSALPSRLTPVYPTVAGVSQAQLRSAVKAAFALEPWPDALPAAIRDAMRLMPPRQALERLHFPPADAVLEDLQSREDAAWVRIIFDELLAQQLSLTQARRTREQLRAPALGSAQTVQRLLAALPFQLTDAQQRAWQGIQADLVRAVPMNRLLQGDVGSGKTVVAALAAAQAAGSGWQSALMAPTEILSEQHYLKLAPWMQACGLRIAWLTGSMKTSEKERVRSAVAAGEVDLLVGTHALIEAKVQFARLGLTIVDEQHRFGVNQRLTLRDKLDDTLLPHQLMMSATPIPRSLAMTFYADLDVSVIDALPPGRTPIVTRLVSAGRREELIERVGQALDQGRQVYWVCPLVEESETLDLQTAIDTHQELQARFAPVPIGLVHGKMPAAAKQATMAAFAAGALKLLVATTVIEVGVDVPQASWMVVEHAERFGLSQLHQLRGRVGRGATQSLCVLLYYPPVSALARERLKVLHDTTDGFEIARRDLQMRGPGELLGSRQSGVPMLRYADLERDLALAEQARTVAAQLLAPHAPAAYAQAVAVHLDQWLSGREAFLQA
jgi:ATP-dependent DNA helicase RecG